jgi:HAMP domain-containing protein
MPAIPTTFLGLFLFSTALSLVATFTVVGAIAIVRRIRNSIDNEQPRIR